MKDKKKKEELLEWLKKLMEYAKDNRLSMRIVDGISDCIKMAETHNPDMREIEAAVEELLESIGHKANPLAEQKAGENVSIKEIREQIAGMAKRCRSKNAESLQNMEKRKQALIQKSYFDLQEITHCEAHLDELKNNERYHRFYEQVMAAHEKGAMYIFREFLSDLANNYQYMIEHMKSMFRSMGGEKSGFGSRRFYEEHDIRRGEIAGKLETIAQNSDCGGSDIGELENATKKKIGKIVQKSLIKLRFLILLPILVVFIFFAAKTAPEYGKSENAQDKAAQEQEYGEGFEELLVDHGLSLVTRGGESGGAAVVVGLVVIFILLVIIVIYARYIRFLKKMCDRQICSKCNTYLQTEWSQFRQKDPLMQKMDAVLINLQDEYERQYLDVLNQLFCKTEYDISDSSKIEQFAVLKEEWSAIKCR